jgi:hypothetical protein
VNRVAKSLLGLLLVLGVVIGIGFIIWYVMMLSPRVDVFFTVKCVDCTAIAVAITHSDSACPICSVHGAGPMPLEGWEIHEKLWSLGTKSIYVASDSVWGTEAYKHYECTLQIGDNPPEVISCGP